MTLLLMTFIKYSVTNIEPDRNFPAFSSTLSHPCLLFLFLGMLVVTIQGQCLSVAFIQFVFSLLKMSILDLFLGGTC